MATKKNPNDDNFQQPPLPAPKVYRRRKAKPTPYLPAALRADDAAGDGPVRRRNPRIYEMYSKYDDLRCGICQELMPKGTPILWAPTCIPTHETCGLPVQTEKTWKRVPASRWEADCECGLRILINAPCKYNVVTGHTIHEDCYAAHLFLRQTDPKRYYQELESFMLRRGTPKLPPELYGDGV